MLNAGEYGQVIMANIGIDVSGASAYTIVIEPMRGDKLIKVATLGTVDIVDDGVKLLANQYVKYTLADGDLDEPGMWRKRGQATMTGKEVVGNYERFMVGE